MSDVYSTIFSDDPRTGALTYPQLEARRKIAIALATRNRPYPKTIGEGLTALGEGIGEGLYSDRVARAETAYQRQSDADIQRLTGQGVTPAAPRAAPGGASLESDPTQAYAMVPPDATAQQPSVVAQASQPPQMTIEEWKQRVARNESGGEKDPYVAIGREANRRGDRAYGKYQVMGENIPLWTKQYLGKEMMPQDFLADPKAQEDLASARGGEYLAKYGANGAAAAWFAGEKGMRDQSRPNLQAWIADYVGKFNRPSAGEERNQIAASAARAPIDPETAAPVQVASLGGGIPTPDTAPDPTRDVIAQSIAGPQPQQNIATPPVQMAQAPQQQLPIGRPVPPPVAVPPAGPPPPPRQEPMTQQEIDIRRAIGASADPTFRGRLEPYADRMEAERKFKDAQNMELWKKDVAAYEKRTDPLYQQQLKKSQQDIITGAEVRPPVDPRVLGTPQSPQRTGIPVPPLKPPNITESKWAELQAPEMIKKIDAADKAKLAFSEINSVIQQARTHPGREWGIGLTAKAAAAIPGSDAAGFAAINDQMAGKVFLEAYQLIKGAGAISEKEGAKAEQAVARLSSAQNMRDYDKALHDLEVVVRSHYEAAQRAVNRPVTAWMRKPDDTNAPDINQIGTRGGKRVKYIGGDPAEDESYQVLQ